MTNVASFRDPGYKHLGGNLNMRQLLNPIFYTRDVRHPDGSRQRGRRQQSKDRRVARRLKSQHVPLCFVDPTIYIQDWKGNWRCGVRVHVPTGRWQKKEVRAVYCPSSSGEWRRHELSA